MSKRLEAYYSRESCEPRPSYDLTAKIYGQMEDISGKDKLRGMTFKDGTHCVMTQFKNEPDDGGRGYRVSLTKDGKGVNAFEIDEFGFRYAILYGLKINIGGFYGKIENLEIRRKENALPSSIDKLSLKMAKWLGKCVGAENVREIPKFPLPVELRKSTSLGEEGALVFSAGKFLRVVK